MGTEGSAEGRIDRAASYRILPRKRKNWPAWEYVAPCDSLPASFEGRGFFICWSWWRSVIITQKEIGKLSSTHSLLQFTKIVLECGKREEVWLSLSESTFNDPPPTSPSFPRPPHLCNWVLDPCKEGTPAGMGGVSPNPCWLASTLRLGARESRGQSKGEDPDRVPSPELSLPWVPTACLQCHISFSILGSRSHS